MPHPDSALPPIVGETVHDGQLSLQLALAPDLFCFDGHFPGFPILPGVVQIHWAVLFARQKLGADGEFCRLEQVKFNDIVSPGSELQLRLSWDAAARRVSFEYRCAERRASSGRVCFV